METTILMPVSAALDVSPTASLPASLDAWYAADDRLVDSMPASAAELCPTAAAARAQAHVGRKAQTAGTVEHEQDTHANAPQGARDGFALAGQPGFLPHWWTSV